MLKLMKLNVVVFLILVNKDGKLLKVSSLLK